MCWRCLRAFPEDLASAWAGKQVMQAVDKMLEGLRSFESPWVGVLEATKKVLHMHEHETKPMTEARP